MGGGEAGEGSECRMPGSPAVEAEDELEVSVAQPMVDAQGPDLEIGEDPMHPGQDDVGGRLADDMGIVGEAGGAGISGPTIGLGGGAGCEVSGSQAREPLPDLPMRA